MPLRVSVAVGKSKPPVDVDLPSRDATVRELKEAFNRGVKKLHPTRQSYKYVLGCAVKEKTVWWVLCVWRRLAYYSLRAYGRHRKHRHVHACTHPLPLCMPHGVPSINQSNPDPQTPTHPPHNVRLELPKEADPKTGKPPRVVRLDEDSKSLASYGYKEGMVLGFKDLGPQIGYRTGRRLCDV